MGPSSYTLVSPHENEDLEDHGSKSSHHNASRSPKSASLGLTSYDHHETPRNPPAAYHHIEQCRHLTWFDSFYDGKHDIIAAFDRDAIVAGNRFMWRFLRTACILWSVSVLYWIMGIMDYKSNMEESIVDDIFGVYTLILGAIFAVLAFRGRQAMLVQHVAITSEGIRVDSGTMVTVTIPFEHVVKIMVVPYRFCFRAHEEFPTVIVQRSAQPLEQLCCQTTKTLELHGILRAQEFADLVLAMKQSQDSGTYEGLDEGRLELQTL